MNTKHVLILALVLSFITIGLGLQAEASSTPARQFYEAIKEYHAGRYAEAADLFSGIAREGVNNPELFYNLGNAYLKNNDLGRSILWYERALRLDPDDPDLKFNLEFARSRVKDLGEDSGNALLKVLFFWTYVLGESTLRWTALIANGLFWAFLMGMTLAKKRVPKLPLGVLATLVVILGATTLFQYYEHVATKSAVILGEKAVVRSGWTEDATGLFDLHAGTKVRVEKEERGYFRISFSKGKIGWLKKEDAEII